MMNSSGHTHGSTNGCKWAIWGLLATHIYYKWRILPYRSPTKVVLADDGRRSCAPSDLRPRFDGDSCLNAQHVSWVWATGNIARPWLEVKTTLRWCTSMMLQFCKTWEVDTRTIPDHWVMDRSATIDFRLLTIRSLSPDQPLCFLKVLENTTTNYDFQLCEPFNGFAGGCYLYIHSKRILTANQKQRLKVLFCSNDEEGLTESYIRSCSFCSSRCCLRLTPTTTLRGGYLSTHSFDLWFHLGVLSRNIHFLYKHFSFSCSQVVQWKSVCQLSWKAYWCVATTSLCNCGCCLSSSCTSVMWTPVSCGRFWWTEFTVGHCVEKLRDPWKTQWIHLVRCVSTRINPSLSRVRAGRERQRLRKLCLGTVVELEDQIKNKAWVVKAYGIRDTWGRHGVR